MGLRERTASLLALAALGCGGVTSEPAHGEPTAAVAETKLAVGPVPLRRLTHEEYNNSVRDLLGDTTRPADAFPPDEAVSGFESNNLAPVTSAWVERYMDASEALASAAASKLDTLAPCRPSEPQEDCARHFIDAFGRRAFRRPLEDEERSTFLTVFSDKAKRAGYGGGIQLVIEAMLQSPQFLYRVEPAEPSGSTPRLLTGYELATRLSYFIWASTPDDELLDEAAAGRLGSAPEVESVARRMLRDPRAADGIRSFHRQWLSLRQLDADSKDTVLSPAFTPELRDAMVEETLRFSTHAVLDGGDTVTTLLTSSTSYVNPVLAKFYGVTPPSSSTFERVELPSTQRAGILTQASVLAVFASADQTSPILRGKFIRERLLCQPIPPPPPGVVFTAPKPDPRLTTKQRFAQHRTDPGCAFCHDMMDPLGFGLEHYDAIGAWRGTEDGHPIDAGGDLTDTDDANGSFDGAVALAKKLSASRQVRRCVATQWFRFALGRSEVEEDTPSLSIAFDTFSRAGFDVRELIVAIATTDAFRHAGSDGGAAL